jgi:hypothetical protein
MFVLDCDLVFQSGEQGCEKVAVVVDYRDLLAFLEIFEFYQEHSNGLGVWAGGVSSLISVH